MNQKRNGAITKVTKPPTPKQKNILEFMETFHHEKGYAPSQHEIAAHFGFKSLGTVQNYLVRLEKQGFLRRPWNSKRGTTLTEITTTLLSGATSNRSSHISRIADFAHPAPLELSAVPLPLLGRVAAGLPIQYTETDQNIDVPRTLLGRDFRAGRDSNYVLRVQGSSMIGDGILDGDYVIIRNQPDARNGQTVIAMIGTEATIKRYYRESRPNGDSRIELRAANPAFEPIVIDSLTDSDFKIEGVLVGVIRKLA